MSPCSITLSGRKTLDQLSHTIFQTWGQYVVIGLVLALGQFIYTAIGFGAGMITVSLLALLYGNINIFVPFFLLLCLPTELTISFKDRKQIDFRRTGTFLIFIFPGLIFGAWVLKNAPDKGLLLALGVVIASVALYYLLFEDSHVFSLNSKRWVVLFGSLSGVLGGVYGISGPPLIVYFKAMRLDKKTFRVALLSIFLAMSIFRSGVYIVMHLYTMPILISTIMALPFALVGMRAGISAHHRLPEHLFKRLTSAILLVSGILLVIKNL